MTGDASKWTPWLLLAASIALSAAGQLCMKAGMQTLAALASTEGAAVFTAPVLAWTGIGLASYALSMLTWLGVLTRLPLSLAYPLLSVSYILVYVGATHWPLIAESATPVRSVGTLLIAAGVFLSSMPMRGAAAAP